MMPIAESRGFLANWLPHLFKANAQHFATREIPRIRATCHDHARGELHKIYTQERVSLEAPMSVGDKSLVPYRQCSVGRAGLYLADIQVLSGLYFDIASATLTVSWPRSFSNTLPSWLMMKVITPEVRYTAG